MRKLTTVFIVAFGFAVVALPGCVEKRSEVEPPPIQQEHYEMIVMIQLDTSGSFQEILQRKGYRFVMAVIDKYFRNRMGSNDRLVLAQISGTTQSLFWDGQPRSLKNDFPSEKAFIDFLMSRPDPGGSRVYDSVAEGLDYLATYPGVPEGKTKVAAICLTDMDDNHPDKGQAKSRLVASLARFSKVNGCIGLYWVDQPEVGPWRQHLRGAGVKNFVVDSQIVADPALPTFD